jgi:hypothetical protein
MPNVNQLLPFGNGNGANVLAFSAYQALSARTQGFASGTALSVQLNTVWRQSAVVSSMIGQFIVDKAVVDVLDDGDVAGLEAKFIAALTALINQLIAAAGTGGTAPTGGPYLPLAGGTMNTGASIALVGSGRVAINGANVWYPGNQGAGSGMDSDLLDGLQSTQFARKDIDSESLANGLVNFTRDYVSSGVYRGMVQVFGKTGQNGGGIRRFLNGAGNQVSLAEVLADDRRTLTWQMWSDAGASFQDQMRLLDEGDIWLRKLNNAGLYAGKVADAIIGLKNRIDALPAPTGGGGTGTGPLDGVGIGSYTITGGNGYASPPSPTQGGTWAARVNNNQGFIGPWVDGNGSWAFGLYQRIA